jgi:hypothetical protein
MTLFSDSFVQKEQEFFEPVANTDHAFTTYPFSYQFRKDLPENIPGAYIYHIPTGRTAFIISKRYFDCGFELRAVNLVWQKIFDFHKLVLEGEVSPLPGEQVIWRHWTWRECMTHLLPPPDSHWFLHTHN